MLRYLVLTCIFFGSFVGSSNPGPSYVPTHGEVWPKPQHELKKPTYYTFNPTNFQVQTTKETCPLLTKAIKRYWGTMKILNNIVNRSQSIIEREKSRSKPSVPSKEYQGNIHTLNITLLARCEEEPYMDMDETYNMTVAATSLLMSKSIWGIMRGLETFSQLFYLSDDYTEVRINATTILDYPRYSYRGLMLDTSRHFLSMKVILKTLDAMAMNKMNVFHWHIVDDQSFPYQSERFPELSHRGAFHSTMVYTKSDIEKIIEYAKERGIRVVPEFDVPGHTRSWGVAFPHALTKCGTDQNARLGPLNPIKKVTYKLLRELFKEVQNLFVDEYFHIGGDEVDTGCWRDNPDIQAFMKKYNISSENKLHAIFMQRAIPVLNNQSKVIVWQDVYDEGVPLAADTLIQVWRYHWVEEMIAVLKAGHKVIFSSSWYLDILSEGFSQMYAADPRHMVQEKVLPNQMKNIVGGEACMWGEMADDANVLSRSWPRSSAVAEVLWSPLQTGYNYGGKPMFPKDVFHRIEEHICRMQRHGIPAEPAGGPGFCVL